MPSSLPASYSETMCGWLSMPAARASVKKARWIDSSSWVALTLKPREVLTATSRRTNGSKPL